MKKTFALLTSVALIALSTQANAVPRGEEFAKTQREAVKEQAANTKGQATKQAKQVAKKEKKDGSDLSDIAPAAGVNEQGNEAPAARVKSQFKTY